MLAYRLRGLRVLSRHIGPGCSPPAQELASPTTLVKIESIVQNLVDTEQIVGAEVLIIQGGKTLLHDVYGWSDIEDKRPMERDSVFCVRSMTKPFIGASIMMLVEEGKIELDAPAYMYLPVLDADPYRMITGAAFVAPLGGLSDVADSKHRPEGDQEAFKRSLPWVCRTI